jgi:hypothetical protein
MSDASGKENSMREDEDAQLDHENNEIQYDEDGNPINPEEGPKEPQNPLKLELIKKSLSKISKTYGNEKLLKYRRSFICLCSFKYCRERIG